MSYIGANPSAADLRLTGAAGIRQATLLQLTVSATAPGTPAEGMVYYNDGSGTISEGLKVYKNGNFVSLDSQEGDADTLQLLQAKDQPAIKFNAAISSTSVVGNTLAVPTPTSTGTIIGTFNVPTTGSDALMSNVDASRVFKYISHSTSDSKSDYWGVPLAIPKGFRGENIVLSFVYRTVTTSTTAMSDGQFKVYIQDKTNGKSVTSTTTGSISAGSNIQVSDRTGIGVGDKILLESGTGNAGAAANNASQAYITSIDGSTGAGNITVSATIQMPATAGGRIITKMLTSLTTSEIKAAPSTAGSGEMKRIAFVPDSTCAEVYLWWQNTASTSSTKVDSLFYDQLLISSNKFLQVESQTKNEVLQVYPSDATTSTGNWSTTDTRIIQFPEANAVYNTTGKLVTYSNTGANGCTITANKECYVEGYLLMEPKGTGEIFGWSLNSTELSTNLQNITAAHIISSMGNTGNPHRYTAPISIRLQPGDVLRPHAGNGSNVFTYEIGRLCLDIKPINQERVIIESEDEIFTDWTAWTPTGTYSTNTTYTGKWRRVGPDMEVQIQMDFAGSPGVDECLIDAIPSGYSVDEASLVSKYGSTDMAMLSSNGNFKKSTDGSTLGGPQVVTFYDGANKIKLWTLATDATTFSYYYQVSSTSNYPTSFASGDFIVVTYKIPITGWRAKFTPLLSMPLVDFGTFENTYSASIAENGDITSQSGNFIASVSKTTGVYTITYTSGFFGAEPAVQATLHTTRDERDIQIDSTNSSATGCEVETYDPGASTAEDNGFFLTVSRQGADYKQPPQPTASIIKPSVAYVKDVQAYNVDGGVTGAANTWHTRTLNTIEGESWFINSLSSNIVTVQPGQYEIEAVQMASQCDNWTSRLYNTTASAALAPGSPNKASAGAYYANSNAKWEGTFTVATGIRLEYIVQTPGTGTDSLGTKASLSGTNSTENSIYAQMKITKLK